MNSQPLVSVIMPTYNCAAYIGEAVASVLTQTYGCYEIIVVDDGSTDGTRTVLAPYWDRIRYVFQDNRGLAAARNAGIREARGQLLALLDTDDIWFPNKLELQVQAFKSHPAAGLAFADFMDFDETSVIRSSRLNTWPEARAWFDRQRADNTEIVCGRMYEELLHRNWIHASSAVVTREVLGKVGGFDEAIRIGGEDLDLWLRIAQRYPVLCVDRVLSGYRHRPESLSGPTGSRAVRGFRMFTTVLEKHVKKRWILEEHQGTVYKELSRRYWGMGWHSFGENRFEEARRYLTKGIRYQPFNRRLWMYWWASFLPMTLIEAVRRFKRRRRSVRLHAEPAARDLAITPSGAEGRRRTI